MTSKSIKIRISLLITAIMVIVYISGFIFIFSSLHDNVEKEVSEQQFYQAEALATELQRDMKYRIDHIGRLGEVLSRMDPDDLENIQQFLEKQYYLEEFFKLGFTLISPDGQGLLAEAPHVENRDSLDFTKSQWFVDAAGCRETVISAPFLGRASGEPMIVLARAIMTDESSLSGILAVPLLLNSDLLMGDYYTKRNGAESSVLVISRPDRIFIVPPVQAEIFDPVPETEINFLHDRAMEGFEGTGRTVNAYGEEEISAMSTVEILDWFVVVRIPVVKAFGIYLKQAYSYLVVGLIILIVTITLVFISLSFYFTPLAEATSAVSRMAAEETEMETLPVTRNDEIGVLINGFNQLVETVRRKTGQLEELSQTDGLTQLYNIRHMNSLMELKWREYRRRKEPVSIIMLDIDFFKKYNDHFGHPEGDNCLVRVSAAMKDTLNRPSDLIARYGGEEFIVLTEGGADEAGCIAEKLRASVEVLGIPHPLSPFGVVTVSVGIACGIPGLDSSVSEMTNRADKALYESKNKGRNQIRIFS